MKIQLTLKDPEYNATDGSILLRSTDLYKTYAEFSDSGECISAKYKGIKCLPKVLAYDRHEATIEIIGNWQFFIKLKIKEFADNIE